MKHLAAIVLFILSMGSFAHAQVSSSNFLESYKSDSLSSTVTNMAESKTAFFFGCNYNSKQNQLDGIPYHSSSIVKVQKGSLISHAINHPQTDTTHSAIAALSILNDTLHSIEIEFSQSVYGQYRIYSKRYDTALNLIQSNLIKTVIDSQHTFYPFVLTAMQPDAYYLFYTIYASGSTMVANCFYDIFDNNTDTAIVNNLRLNPIANLATNWIEYCHYTSVDDSGNVLVSLHIEPNNAYPVFVWNTSLIEISKQDKTQRRIIQYNPADTTATFSTLMARPPVAAKRRGSFYFAATSQSLFSPPYQDITGLNNSKRIVYYKGKLTDSLVRMDTCYNSLPAPFFANNSVPDVTHYTSASSSILVGDSIILDVHPCNASPLNGVFFATQSERSAMQINILDTNLIIKHTFYLYDSTKNSAPTGFGITKEGNILVYGTRCTRGAISDSAYLFAVLLDYNTGYPLNIFNAEGIINPFAVKVFPNPFTNQLYIETTQKEQEITLFNIKEQKVRQQKLHTSTTNINTDALPNGMYFYRITDKQNSIINTGKLLKE